MESRFPTAPRERLDLALRVIGIGFGDEVIVPAFSYVATAAAVAIHGGVPVFADIERRNLGMDAQSAEDRLTARTRSDSFNRSWWESVRLRKIDGAGEAPSPAADRGWGVQSIGSTYAGKPALSFGLISTLTSFHAAKTMTTVEGGMVFTTDDDTPRLPGG